MRNFLNRISRGGNCVCVSIILGYVCLKKNPSFLLWFGQVVFREAPSGPKTFALYRRPLRTKYCGKEYCWDPPFKLRQLVLKKEAVPMIFVESCKPVIRQNKNEKQVHNARRTANELLEHQFPPPPPQNDALTPFPSHVSMLWNLCGDPTPLGYPCPTKIKV